MVESEEGLRAEAIAAHQARQAAVDTTAREGEGVKPPAPKQLAFIGVDFTSNVVVYVYSDGEISQVDCEEAHYRVVGNSDGRDTKVRDMRLWNSHEVRFITDRRPA